MRIDPQLCTGCGSCIVYCPVEAISFSGEKTSKGKQMAAVDLDRCVECGNCLRAAICPVDAVNQQPLEWPRSVRSAFSNPRTEHKSKDMGRGTEEMKTNEVTNRIQPGEVGVAVELGRPILGASFRDVEKVAMAMARIGIEFEERNPLTALMEDTAIGTMQKEILDERVLSTIVEFKAPEEKLGEILTALKAAAKTIDTVFSVAVITRLEGGKIPMIMERVAQLGFRARPNGKVNLGLGRAIQD